MVPVRRKRRLLTSPLIVPATSYVVGLMIRGLVGSLRVWFEVKDPASVPRERCPGIYLFWHEMLLLPVYTHSHLFVSLISQSHDGELMARVVRRLGGKAIRGSTTRGRIGAFREITRQVQERPVGIAADGPRGPARKVPLGIIRAAGFSGRPIVPVGMAFSACVRIGPAGREVAFPLPLSTAWVVVGSPLTVPPIRRDLREEHLLRVQTAMDQAQIRAEGLAAGRDRSDTAISLRESLRL